MSIKKKSGNGKQEILIAEDSPTQAEQLKYLLGKHGYQVSVANNGKDALTLLQRRKPLIVISDIVMPEMDGYQLCRQIKSDREFKDIPVILLTALSDPEDVISGLECGADNFITKPYDEKYLIARVDYLLANMHLQEKDELQVGITIHFGENKYFINSSRLQIFNLLLSTYETAIQKNRELEKVKDELRRLNDQLEERVKERTVALTAEIAERKQAEAKVKQSYEKLKKALEGTIFALAATVEKRDPYTAGHQERATQLACAIAMEMNISDAVIEGIRMAGAIHDLGKIYVPAEILSKPGQLNNIEFDIIKEHPQVAYDILMPIDFPWPIAQIVYQHHERMDGSGYPLGLPGESILLEARILGTSDVIEAIASHRPYRPALGIDKALEEISQKRGTLYDADVVDACLKVFTEKGFKFEKD